MRVVVVDDAQDFVDSLTMILQIEGFEVSAAHDGHEALRLVDAGLRPDVFLLDHRMPGLTGSEVLAHVRARGVDAPAILVSAVRNVDEIAARHGFHDWISKPCDPSKLIAKIRRVAPPNGSRT